MEIETVEDLANEIANWIGCYGCCKSAEEGKDECEDKSINCCRVGFMMVMPDRIRKAVENENKLKNIF
jgi:hypothetical protein